MSSVFQVVIQKLNCFRSYFYVNFIFTIITDANDIILLTFMNLNLNNIPIHNIQLKMYHYVVILNEHQIV